MKNKYAKAAVHAVLHYQNNPIDIVQSWQKAVSEQFPDQVESQKKGCPKSAFLGLCENGLVKGVPVGKYTRGKLNKSYAIKAVEILNSRSHANVTPKQLWKLVMNGETKTSNSQMDVVLALAEKNLLNI